MAPLLACVSVFCAVAWLVAGFWTSVDLRVPRQTVAAPTASLPWAQAVGDSSHSFFRLAVPLGAVPDTATLWVDADQVAVVYVNGYRVNSPVTDIPNEADLVRSALVFDIRGALFAGANTVGLEVINEAERPAAFQAELDVTVGGQREILGTRPSDWLATSNVAYTDQEMPLSGSWAVNSLEDSQWSPAVASAHHTAATLVAVDPDGFRAPTVGTALLGASTSLLTAAATLEVPAGCQQAWLRFGASGPYTLSWDGNVIASGEGGSADFGDPALLAAHTSSLQVQPLELFDICSLAHEGGRNRLVVVVAGGDPARAYIDGYVEVAGRWTSLLDHARWTSAAEVQQGPAAEQWFHPFEIRTAMITLPSSMEVARHAWLTLLLLLCGAGLVGLSALTGLGTYKSAQAMALGSLPAGALSLGLSQLHHLLDVTAPFPSTPRALEVLLLVAACGSAGALVAAHSLRGRHLAPPEARVRRRLLPKWLVDVFARRRYSLAVWAFAGVWSLANAYHLSFGPLWQDELSSLAAAQGIRAHLLPEWPSGFLYWKSELYSALLAVVGPLVQESTAWLRGLSVIWLGATIVIFGTRLVPVLIVRGRLAQFAATVLFAVAPFETVQARDIRMYQMAQFFVVLLTVLLLKALAHPKPRSVFLAMLTMDAMYLSHEETFPLVLLVPLLVTVATRGKWLTQWYWWAFGGAAYFVVAVQLALATFTHPPIFGVDDSNGPLVAWMPAPWYYINQYFFIKSTMSASITAMSLLALLAVAVGLKRRSAARLTLAYLWVGTVAVISLALPAKDTRYAFVTLPFVLLLGFCGALDIFDWLRARLMPSGRSQLLPKLCLATFGTLAWASLLASMIGSYGDFGILAATLTGANIAQQHADYGPADEFVRARLQPGDIVIAACTPNLVAQGLGRPPNYWLPYRRASRLLYLIEKNGQAVDTQYGIPAINDGTQLERVVDEHKRVWLIVYDNYLSGLLQQQQQILRTRFQLVEEDATVSTFFDNG